MERCSLDWLESKMGFEVICCHKGLFTAATFNQRLTINHTSISSAVILVRDSYQVNAGPLLQFWSSQRFLWWINRRLFSWSFCCCCLTSQLSLGDKRCSYIVSSRLHGQQTSQRVSSAVVLVKLIYWATVPSVSRGQSLRQYYYANRRSENPHGMQDKLNSTPPQRYPIAKQRAMDYY